MSRLAGAFVQERNPWHSKQRSYPSRSSTISRGMSGRASSRLRTSPRPRTWAHACRAWTFWSPPISTPCDSTPATRAPRAATASFSAKDTRHRPSSRSRRLRGFYPLSRLSDYGQDGSVFAEHPPTPDHLPGLEAATGSLGHGLPMGVGMALAARIQGHDYNVVALCWRRRVQRRHGLGSGDARRRPASGATVRRRRLQQLAGDRPQRRGHGARTAARQVARIRLERA